MSGALSADPFLPSEANSQPGVSRQNLPLPGALDVLALNSWFS